MSHPFSLLVLDASHSLTCTGFGIFIDLTRRENGLLRFLYVSRFRMCRVQTSFFELKVVLDFQEDPYFVNLQVYWSVG